ncbi:MAG TPA: IclR family transcriptional regulator C-terminal domain-containing protein, partial [Terriglobales bacterium]|nr:IclR family transcriptional regulator C-terminal domain-containing protein [Terriglobales bacterium]
SSTSLPTIAQPILEQVTEAVHESSSLSVLEGDEIVYLARSAAKRVMSVGLSVGSRLPAYCTSMGRVLLSGLPSPDLNLYLNRVDLKAFTPKTVTEKDQIKATVERIRGNGYALTDEELELGLRSIAVPVHNRSRRIVAAMNIGVHASRVSAEEMIQRFLPVLQENASLLAQVMG